MSYKNIVFAKLEKRLFNDPRWFMMHETSQLNYIKFILLSMETYNKIPKDLDAIRKSFKTNQTKKTIQKSIDEIKINFPKFKESSNFFYFEGFEEKTNYVREVPGKSRGNPKTETYKDKEEDKEEEEYKEKEKPGFLEILLSDFSSLYSASRGIEYIPKVQDKKQIALLLSRLKKTNPNLNTEQMRTHLKGLFEYSLSIKDKWFYENMSPAFIYSKINEIRSKGAKQNGNSIDNIGEQFESAYSYVTKCGA